MHDNSFMTDSRVLELTDNVHRLGKQILLAPRPEWNLDIPCAMRVIDILQSFSRQEIGRSPSSVRGKCSIFNVVRLAKLERKCFNEDCGTGKEEDDLM